MKTFSKGARIWKITTFINEKNIYLRIYTDISILALKLYEDDETTFPFFTKALMKLSTQSMMHTVKNFITKYS